MPTYLDWNATAPRHPDVRRAMEEAEGLAWANPSSVHQAGRAARQFVEDAREELGRVLCVSPRDIVFTGGGTEANHLALSGAKQLVTTRIEHPSIVAQAERLRDLGAVVAFAGVGESGRIEPQTIADALDELGVTTAAFAPRDQDKGGFNNENTPLVAVMAVNHETGVMQPLREISEITRARGARLHVDAVQLVGRGDLRVLQYADSISLAAHKFRGPKGLGVLAFQCGWTPLPLGRGGAQERGLRPGTVDAVALSGLRAALKRLDDSRAAYGRAALLGQRLREALSTHARFAVLHGDLDGAESHVVNFRVPGWKGDELVAALDLAGVCVSSGSACSAGTAEPSAVITEMLGREAAVGAVRVSFGEESTEADLLALTSALVTLGILDRDAGSVG